MQKYTLTYDSPFAHYREPGDSKPMCADVRQATHSFEAENDEVALATALTFIRMLPNFSVTVNGVTREARHVRLVREILFYDKVNMEFPKVPVAAETSRGTYSFYYRQEGYETYAMDWNFWPDKKGQWAASAKDGIRWYPHPETEENMHKALLEHFGLSAWAKEYPWSRVETMSPRRLAEEHAHKAHLHNLSCLEIRSDTAGYRVLATNHIDLD